MVTKKQAIQFATELGWTQADANRAYEASGIKLELVDDNDKFTLALALADFAGEVLSERQRQQARQKGEVTRKNNEIKTIKLDYEKKVKQFEAEAKAERSLFVTVIGRFYGAAKLVGFKDPWIEALLAQYDEYMQDDSQNAAS